MSSPIEPPESRKRQRTVKEEPPADESLRCHPDLCYEDGNVNLIAGSTLFRVHRGMLAKFSPVLKARIFMSSAADMAEHPLTLRLDDDCSDVEHLLYTLYDKKSTQVPKVSVELLSVWLRLGTKYQIAHLQEEATRRLNVFYPESLEELSRVLDGEVEEAIDIIGDCGSKEAYTEHLTFALLASSHKLNRISILAMYDLSVRALGFENIADALVINDALIRTVKDPQSQTVWLRCFLGRAHLEAMNSDHRLSFLDGELSQKCKTKPACTDVMKNLNQEAHDAKLFVSSRAFLEDIADSFIQTSGKSACNYCREFWVARHLKGHQTIYNALPSIFGMQLDDGEWKFEDIDDEEEAENQSNGGGASQNKS